MKASFQKIFAARFFCAVFVCADLALKCFGFCSPRPLWADVRPNIISAPQGGRATENHDAEASAAIPAQNKDETKAAHALYEKAMNKKDAADRFRLLQEGVARYPFAAELHYGLGREYHQRANLDSALVHFERVLILDATLARKTDLDTFLPQAYAAMATQALKQGKLSEAVQAAQNALRHEAGNVPALNVATLAFYQLKQFGRAIAHGEQLLKLQPSAQNYNNLAAAYEAQGELSAALQNYQQALVLEPTLFETQKNLARVRTRIEQLNTVQKDAPKKIPEKTSSSVRIRLEQKPKTAVSAQTVAPLKSPIPKLPASTKASWPRYPFTKFKVGPPRTHTFALKLQVLPRLPAPAEEWNTVRATERNSLGATIWIVAVLALGVIIWRSMKRKSGRALLGLIAGFFAKRKTTHKSRAAQALPSKETAELNADGVRMLRRAVAEETPRLAAKTLSAEVSSSPNVQHFPILAPERARAALPAPATPPPASPQIGLQTEMLFAEMIAAAPEAFESTNISAAMPRTDEATGNGKSNGTVMQSNSVQPARANGVLDHGAASAVAYTLPIDDEATLSHANGADGISQTPLLPSAPAVTLIEHRPAAASPEIQTSRLETRAVHTVQERTPAAAHATPAPATLQTTTRAMEVPALTMQRIGRYIIEKELAQGTTGKIYKTWDPKLDRVVVLKTVQYGISTSAAEIAALKDRIYREARAIAKLSHPNIVIVYDVDDQADFSYLVMEYLEGHDLKQVLEREHRLDCGRALEIVAQVCSAMEYAHRAGVFHRDVKPSNIMLLEQDEVKVMDFGIAKISNYLSLTQTGRVLGTPSYMAPEQIEGQATDGRADLFSLGIVLYELLVGRRPFMADSLAALAYKIVHKAHMPPSLENVELPLELDEVLNRALAKRPEERYQNATELREAVLAVRAKLG